MRKAFLLVAVLRTAISQAQVDVTHTALETKSFDPSTVIWFNKPAAKWEEALPIGNGRLGAMIYGIAKEEIIQLNEETYWSGGPYSTVVKGGHTKLKEIQRLVFEGKMLEAHNLFGRNLMGYPVEQQKYQSLGRLFLEFDHTAPSNYKRWLDLATGIAYTEYTEKGIHYHREMLSSVPHQVIAIHFTADKPGSISFKANLRGVRNQAHSNYGTDYFRMDGLQQDGLLLTGKSADYLGVKGSLRYEAQLKVRPVGGKMSVDNYILTVTGADEVTLYIAAATNFVNFKDVSGDAHERVESYFSTLGNLSYATVKSAHVKDHQMLFGRVSLNLPTTEASFAPTDERLKGTSTDASMAALCYQFGRYILMGSSRPGTQPANLQGIWNDEMNPAWDSKYTTNINTEMNYWPVHSANLTECEEPLFNMVRELMEQGTEVAREHYGARGWVFHQNTDLYRVAAPMDGPSWGTFTVGGAWLVNTLWEHYEYTKDKKYLERIYPIMKGSVEFFMDFLIAHPNGKGLVTNPSTSPENFPKSPGNGRYFDEVTGSYIPGTTICAGSSIDMQILTDLFNSFEKASDLLQIDRQLKVKVSETRMALVQPQIGKDGSLQEWADDWGQLEEKHRHFSHLYGLYPGNVLSPRKTPQFMNACRAVLEQREDGGTGWSRSWKVALWARLHDGDRAERIFRGYLAEQAYPQLFAKCYTPLQVDGTLGMTAGVSEMLVQSHDGAIEFLPALPTSWTEGTFNGVCVRGGFVVNLTWKKNKLTSATLISRAGTDCRIFSGNEKLTVISEGKSVKTVKQN
ncbi:MAG: glycoside hydrolase family 95 protein, partial [Cyclobacteriaceae bacterium]|nr:glycoside hydrolase family 95 protein [Cyclobacteriaceae bacterium]